MKKIKLFRILTITLVLSLLMMVLPVLPALAASESIELDPEKGEIGDEVEVTGEDFDESYEVTSTEWVDYYVTVYFSSEEADEGDEIDDEVENYEIVDYSDWVDEDGDNIDDDGDTLINEDIVDGIDNDNDGTIDEDDSWNDGVDKDGDGQIDEGFETLSSFSIDSPGALAISPDGDCLYVTDSSENSVRLIRTSDNTLIDTVPVDGHPESLCASQDGEYLYVVYMKSSHSTSTRRRACVSAIV